MASNRFGTHFSFTTFGESHGEGIGVVIDGCPSDLSIDLEKIGHELSLRKPGKAWTSPREEGDEFEILSGIYLGKTTGAPIAFFVKNRNQKKEAYQSINHLYRPGHANFTYHQKYRHFDPNGGGRASARETVARVIAGSIAKQFLDCHGIKVFSYLDHLGECKSQLKPLSLENRFYKIRNSSPIFSIDEKEEKKMLDHLAFVQQEGDSIGGIVRTITSELPIGLGDPIYEKLEAFLAFAMLSIPGTRGFEFGSGFDLCALRGSQANDLFYLDANQNIKMQTNHSGGTLGGISNGSSIDFRVCFKPTSSIKKIQPTLSLEGTHENLDLGPHARHDPCIAIRGVIVVEAMAAIVIADRLLANRLVHV